MPTVALSQVKPGDRIASDVVTSLGGTLFHRGRVVTPREYEILQAFLIRQVDIEPREGAMEPTEMPLQDNGPSQLDIEYERLFNLLKRLYMTNTSGIGLPILELRTALEAVLRHIKEYNVLTFSPRHMADSDYLFHNSVLTALTSFQLAQWCLFPQKDWVPVALAALFHDIGMIRVDSAIVNKPNALTAQEAEEMKNHTVHGYNLLKHVPAINEGVKLTALQHHEKVDGSGYPLGIAGDKIHPYARLVAIADIFHAMTQKRSYRKPISPYLVLEQIQNDSFGKLDPIFVRTFIERTTSFHNGIIVQLSDGRIGEIVFSDRHNPTRPWVSVNGTIVNLVTERHIHIDAILRR